MEEKHLASFGTDTAISEEFFDLLRTKHLDPEKALLLAVLEDAVHCFDKYGTAQDPVGKEQFREVENWIMHRGNDWIFSFDNVCELLGLDPQYVRHGLQKRRAKTVQSETRRRRHGPRRKAA